MKKQVKKSEALSLKREVERAIKEFEEEGKVKVRGGKFRIKITKVPKPYLAYIRGNTINVDFSVRKYPKYVLKYIVAHELAHTVTGGHSKRFYEIVSFLYPNFKKAQRKLRSN